MFARVSFDYRATCLRAAGMGEEPNLCDVGTSLISLTSTKCNGRKMNVQHVRVIG